MNDKDAIESLRRRASLIAREIKSSLDDGNKKVTISGNNFYIGSSKQTVRDENQDKVVCARIHSKKSNNNIVAIVIADGMGGLSFGGTAAAEAIAFFLAYLSTTIDTSPAHASVEKSIEFANNQIFSTYKRKAGTTLAAVVFFKKTTLIANVGDSRIYACNNGILEQISKDDSLKNIFNESTEEPKDNVTENLDNRLLQFIGLGPGIRPHIINHPKAQKNQKFILTSDGVHYIRHNILERIIQNAKSDEDIVKRTILLADWMGGHDNATIAVLPQALTLKDSCEDAHGLTIEISTNTKRSSIVIDSPEPLQQTPTTKAPPAPTTKKNKDNKKQDTPKKMNLLFEFNNGETAHDTESI